MRPRRGLRDLAGVVLLDLPRYWRALRHSGAKYRSHPKGWIGLRNRAERLQAASEGLGVRCDWNLGNALHAAQVLPFLGDRLLRAALAEWPIQFARNAPAAAECPEVSFIFAHSGSDRLPQLRQTLYSLFAQRDTRCEFIVVDQSPSPLLPSLPEGIVYRHLSKEGLPKGWYKSWAYNVGARLARAPILVFQDGDICAPSRYAAEVVQKIGERGYRAASLQRFLCYLDQAATRAIHARQAISASARTDLVYQNWKGGTIAVARDAFFALGGFDEGFADWGGEDDEFYDRCSLVGHCRHGYLPFVHLWHAPQDDSRISSNLNMTEVLPWRLSMPADLRAAELRSRAWGSVDHPDPSTSYKSQLVK